MKKIGQSFSGVIIGFILVVVGIGILWWNEGNNVKNIQATKEMDKKVIDITSDKINPKNEGKLIATSGKLQNDEELSDDIFNVKVTTPIMKRIVEVYQWKEESDTDDNGNTTYRYEKTWSDEIIDSAEFHETGHENLNYKKYENEVFTSNNVKVGAFTLSSNQVESLSTKAYYGNFNEETISNLGFTTFNSYITTSKDMNNPEIGDIRISFKYNNSKEISVLAVQKGNSFVNFVSKSGKTVNKIMEGNHSGAEMINEIKSGNKMMKWAFRLAGAVLIIAGIAAILGPISTITSVVPIVGGIVGGAIGILSFVLGLALSLVIIAIAWIRFRPLLGIGLLLVVAALISFLIINGKKAKEKNQISNEQNNNEEGK